MREEDRSSSSAQRYLLYSSSSSLIPLTLLCIPFVTTRIFGTNVQFHYGTNFKLERSTRTNWRVGSKASNTISLSKQQNPKQWTFVGTTDKRCKDMLVKLVAEVKHMDKEISIRDAKLAQLKLQLATVQATSSALSDSQAFSDQLNSNNSDPATNAVTRISSRPTHTRELPKLVRHEAPTHEPEQASHFLELHDISDLDAAIRFKSVMRHLLDCLHFADTGTHSAPHIIYNTYIPLEYKGIQRWDRQGNQPADNGQSLTKKGVLRALRLYQKQFLKRWDDNRSTLSQTERVEITK